MNDYTSIKQVAEHFKVSLSTVRLWLRNGKLPPYAYMKVGRTYRFRIADVEAALRGTLAPPVVPQQPAVIVSDVDQEEM